jgi:glycogen phosphorylase
MSDLKLPKRIGRLDELANNLWWSWQEDARKLFRSLDYPLWKQSGHNPVKQLLAVSPETLQAASTDASFLSLYDSVMTSFDKELNDSHPWFPTTYPTLLNGPIAFFSMEYAIHNCLPIYAGGLGVLAGDILKEASDLGIPMVAVGFMYPQGYFHQHISSDGWQQEINSQLDFREVPITRVLSAKGEKTIAQVKVDDVTISIGVWQVKVGRTTVLLLDTNLEENPARYQGLDNRLYIADHELRLQQEVVLGIGGVRVLRAMGIKPSIWHINEGHTAFSTLERIKEEMANGKNFDVAMSKIQAATVFTTHTPVPAGHDVFSVPLMDKYFKNYQESLGISRDAFFNLGQMDSRGAMAFNMTALALKMSNQRCAVSLLHEKVTRRMWHGLWPQLNEDQVPISHVTNGVHMPSWLSPEMCELFNNHLGEDWRKKHDDPALWEQIAHVPDEEIWGVRQKLKRKLIGAIRERMRERWVEDGITQQQLGAMGAFLDPDVLVICFTRRFVEYKRATLLFRDINRLKKIINNPWQPVQIVFAGKSHPADFASKSILQQVYNEATNREFQGRIAFLEDYDIHLAHYLVHGADVWLNTPRRLQEASGTSGMKSAFNGGLHLSVRDGWWHEGYNGNNGWAIGKDADAFSPDDEDVSDAESLYRLLEDEIVPLYYARDRNGIPHGWLRMVKDSIHSLSPVFCTRRMLKEYTQHMYEPAARSSRDL